eukprot:TRINITY_DN1160_c0_g1_i3.p1 TRINITY_DN1160_c0_g1~~TRINITY_DN1160_c0_g1_i3.p1  ORF type:complete len:182 (-),score=55.65 TRINITY_DN1160_c0_g1_i3:234-779(-)
MYLYHRPWRCLGMRKLKLKVRPRMVGIAKKTERREAVREQKALQAAQLERSIERELLDRLKQGTYGDIYNFPTKEYEKVLDEEELSDEEEEGESESEDEQEREMEGEEEDMPEFVEEYIDEESDMEDHPGLPRGASSSSSEDGESTPVARRTRSAKKPKGPRVEVEYEEERETAMDQNQDW